VNTMRISHMLLSNSAPFPLASKAGREGSRVFHSSVGGIFSNPVD